MYLTDTEAETRLRTRYSLTTDLTIGDVMLASLDLDELAPFKGEKTNAGQVREFPRDGETVVPDNVLDWVALRAYALVSDKSEGVTRSSIGKLSMEHAPSYSQTARRLARLVTPYLERTARV